MSNPYKLCSMLLLLCLPQGSLALAKFLHRAAALSHSASSHKGMQRLLHKARASEDPGTRTLHLLDTDGSGGVDADEVAAFAAAQGLDSETAKAEFPTLDANGDGILDAAEVASALGSLTEDAEQPAAVETEPEQAPAVTLVKSASSSASLDDAELLTRQNRSKANDMQQGATTLVDSLSMEMTQEAAARDFERRAEELRENATSMTHRAVQDVVRLGSAAASSKADELLRKLVKLHDKAEEAEVQAAAFRARSKGESVLAHDLMAVADAAMKGLDRPDVQPASLEA